MTDWFCLSEELEEQCFRVFFVLHHLSRLPLPFPASPERWQIPEHGRRLKVAPNPFLFGQKGRHLSVSIFGVHTVGVKAAFQNPSWPSAELSQGTR